MGPAVLERGALMLASLAHPLRKVLPIFAFLVIATLIDRLAQ